MQGLSLIGWGLGVFALLICGYVVWLFLWEAAREVYEEQWGGRGDD